MTHAAIVLCYFPNVEYTYGHNAKNKRLGRPMSKWLNINALFHVIILHVLNWKRMKDWCQNDMTYCFVSCCYTTCPKLEKNERLMSKWHDILLCFMLLYYMSHSGKERKADVKTTWHSCFVPCYKTTCPKLEKNERLMSKWHDFNALFHIIIRFILRDKQVDTFVKQCTCIQKNVTETNVQRQISKLNSPCDNCDHYAYTGHV
jgi:hypothetical protein